MYLRIFSSLLALGVLSACEAAQSPEPEGDSIECAIGEGGAMTSECTLEWVGEEWASEFLIHHGDGGFRRFSIGEEPGTVVLNDGAESVEMTPGEEAGVMQFTVAGDTYRMPTAPASGA